MTVTIRPAELTDAEALAPLHQQVWEEVYTGLMPQRILDDRGREPLQRRVERWRGRIARPDQRTWVAVDGDEIVGFGESGRGRDGGGELELRALYVRASHYDTGLGHRLLHEAIGDEPAYLWVFDGNARAIRFYERHGFAFDGQVKVAVEGLDRRMVRGRAGAAHG